MSLPAIVKVISHNSQGQLKTKGGDTWVITLREDEHHIKWVVMALMMGDSDSHMVNGYVFW